MSLSLQYRSRGSCRTVEEKVQSMINAKRLTEQLKHFTRVKPEQACREWSPTEGSALSRLHKIQTAGSSEKLPRFGKVAFGLF